MDFYGRKNLWKFILFLFAAMIGIATLWYTESFLDDLRQEEIKKVNQWSSALSFILNAGEDDDITCEQNVVQSNTTIPIILTDQHGRLIQARNVNEKKLEDAEWVAAKIEEMRSYAEPLVIDLGNGVEQYIYYQNSILLTKLRYYPMILLVVIGLFIIIAYIAFSNARRAEQNQVWNGLAKETAHQIGTPLTSLMGWIELLREKEDSAVMVREMEKDIQRLNMITQRFSKIGSQPSKKPHNIVEVCREAVAYLQSRSPGKITISYHPPREKEIMVELNKELIEWVIENLIRNAIDAIETNKGYINITLCEHAKAVRIEVQDTGKGIPPNKFKTIFRPGYTTKSRGWGLGLSLARRIVEEYHKGKIYVSSSEPGKGSSFRVVLKKMD